MDKKILFFIIIALVVLIIVWIVCGKNVFENYNNQKHRQQTQQLLLKIKTILDQFVDQLDKKYPQYESVQLLCKRYKSRTQLKESKEAETYTLNKGEKVRMCLRNYKKNGEIHNDLNLLLFVAIHELGHIMSVSNHHTDEFWKNFKFLLNEAAMMGYYIPVDYAYDPAAYCAMTVFDNPFFYEKTKQENAEEFQNLLFGAPGK